MLGRRAFLGIATNVSFIAACIVVGAVGARGDTIAYSPNITSGSQGFDNLFGMDFDSNQAIVISQLGVFDNGGDGVLNTDSPTQPIVVQVWDRDTGVALATANFGGGSTTGTLTAVGAGQYFFKPVSLTLPAGGHYYVSEDYSLAEKFGNVGNAGYVSPTVQDGGGLVSFVGRGRASQIHNAMFNGNDTTNGGTSTAPAPPATTNGFLDSGPAARYTGPNFQFAAATPEPASLAIIGLTAGGLLLRRRASRGV